MFSIPLNPKLDNIQIQYFVDFCKQHKDYIYDIYFTCRMPPFVQDAMGDVFLSSPYDLIEVALKIHEETGIAVSATFNNTEVRPTQDNLDLFILNFKQLYDHGIKSITIPHTHWTATGQLQKEFPDLLIKNTILRNVETAKDVAKLGESGFHYVNIHRDLMRDVESLKRIRKAADKYNMKVALLANEGCSGGCPVMKEHFQFNNTRANGPQYFNDPISRVSCSKWSVQDPAYYLKVANLPPWKEDWIELLQYVDVFKMHGRESIDRFFETLNIVEKFKNDEEILFGGFEEYLKDSHLEERPINAWRKIIKTCKFDCWDCNFCDKVYESKSSISPSETINKLASDIVDHVNSDYDNDIPGLTSSRVKKFLNTISNDRKNYLEVGSAMGATAVAVLDNGIPVTCVDNWEEDIQPQDGAFDLPNNTFSEFKNNTSQYKNLKIVNANLFDAELEEKYDMFFYDGPHSKQETSQAIQHYSQYFDRECIIVLDDANWTDVVMGALEGINKTQFNLVYQKMILNNIEDSTKWWNGLFVMVVQHNDKII